MFTWLEISISFLEQSIRMADIFSQKRVVGTYLIKHRYYIMDVMHLAALELDTADINDTCLLSIVIFSYSSAGTPFPQLGTTIATYDSTWSGD